jgi:hypothetical protein
MKAREKRRRRALRQQHKRCELRLVEYWEGWAASEWPLPWPGPVSWPCGECDPEFPCYGQLEHCIRYVPEAP